MNNSTESNNEAWGHKVVLVTYVEGGQDRAELAAECILGQVAVPGAAFMGMSIEPVQDKPNDQVAT